MERRDRKDIVRLFAIPFGDFRAFLAAREDSTEESARLAKERQIASMSSARKSAYLRIRNDTYLEHVGKDKKVGPKKTKR